MNGKASIIPIALIVLMACGLLGCSAASAQSTAPTAEPVAAAQPPLTATMAPPTLTPTPSATPSTTPTPTSTPSVTPTPSATATATTTPFPTPWPTPDGPLTWDERAQLFDALWATVNTQYLDPNFNGVDWAAQREWYRPRALAAPDDEAYYALLKEMVLLLNDGHSRFQTPHEALQHIDVSRGTLEYGGFGLYTMPLPLGALVLQVTEGSPADRAGVRACDRVIWLNGERYPGDEGPVGSGGELTMARPSGERYTLQLRREQITQELGVPAFIVSGREARIGYVRLDTLWLIELPEMLRDEITRMEADGPLDGLIIDLRTNLGGWRRVLRGSLAPFVHGELGTFYGQVGDQILEVPGRGGGELTHPDLPLAVLVGPRTESYAELLAATLQAERDAIVVGQPSRGNVETIFWRRLPFGARVWISEQGFRLNDGRTIEGVGVIPDVPDRTDWTAYPCGADPQIAIAAEALVGR